MVVFLHSALIVAHPEHCDQVQTLDFGCKKVGDSPMEVTRKREFEIILKRIRKYHSQTCFCIWSLWAESNWETAETWRALWPPFFYLGGDKFPTRKVPFLCQEEKNILGPWHKKSMPRRVCTNLSKTGLSFTSFPHVFPSHFLTIYYSWPKHLFPSSCHVFATCHYLLKWQRSPQV